MRKQFDDELAKLKTGMRETASLCEQEFEKAVQAFFNGNENLFEDVFTITRSIDKKCLKMENLCFMLLLRYQPVAIDLRTITATLKTNFDIKRISSQCFDIVEIVKLSHIAASKGADTQVNDILKKMSAQTKRMMTASFDTFFAQDPAAANGIKADDDVVDECFSNIKSVISTSLARSSGSGDYAVDILMIAKYFERIADHCVNIARWTVKYFG